MIKLTNKKDGKLDVTIKTSKNEMVLCVEIFKWSLSEYTKEKYKKYFKEEVKERVKSIDERVALIKEIDNFNF